MFNGNASTIKTANEDNFLDLCNTVTIDINENQANADIQIETETTVGSSFNFGSGTTLASNEEAVYFVLEPNECLEDSTKGFSHSEIHTPIEVLPSSMLNVSNKGKVRKDNKVYNEENHKIIPGRTRAGVTKCLELGCNFTCARIPQLRIHLEEEHGIPQERKVFAFKSEKDFKSWLSEVEKEARCTFMRRRGWQMNKNGSSTACFYCHRGGAYTSKATKKQVKTQGSCKTGVECTSSMKVTMWTVPDNSKNKQEMSIKHVQVEAYLQHYGHNLDLNHTRLTKTEKDDIARKLSCGISRNKILDDVRGTLDTSKSPNRLHLLSLQDLYNIEKKEGIKSSKKNSGDEEGTTVQAWIEKMQKSEENPVLLIKYQQEKAKEECSCLSDDDFILILQTPLQAMMLRRYGPHQCICIDVTRGDSNSNGGKGEPCFYLMSIEVIIPILNDREEVFPVAWFVSNRKDEAVIRIFLSQIKKNLSDLTLTPSYLLLPCPGITGGCDWFPMWTSIFGPGPRKLFCPWHIMNAWKQRVQRASLKTNQEESRLITNLQTVLHSSVLDEFVQLLEQFLTDLSRDSTTLSLVNYFKAMYANQPEIWSRAYRSESQLQTEAKFEEFHNKTVRHIYHEGFKRKQLDVLIKTLMRHSRDRALNKLRQSFKLTNEASIRRLTSSNHSASLKLPINFVKTRTKPRTWSVMSVIDRVRAVERSADSGKPIVLKKVAVEYIVTCAEVDRCPARLNCAYRCSDCEICSHHFTCTCQSDQKALAPGEGLPILCEHCHLVVQYMLRNSQQVDSLFPIASADSINDKIPTDNQSSVTDANQVVVMVIEDVHQSVSIVNDVTSQPDSSSLDKPPEEVCVSEESDSSKMLTEDCMSEEITGDNEVVIDELDKDTTPSLNIRRSGRRRNVSYNSKEFPPADFISKLARSSETVAKPPLKREKLSEMSKKS